MMQLRNLICGLSLLALLLAIPSVSSFAEPAEEKSPEEHEGLVVHEWGVKWVGYHPAGPIPILGAKGGYLESLPDFVVRNEDTSPTTVVQQPMVIYKPVIHFYGEEGEEINVSIQMPDGAPIVYYPLPKVTRSASAPDRRGLRPQIMRTTEISWSIKLHKALPGKLAKAPEGHWWNDVREVPGDYVTLNDGSASERFLFYEGTTTRKPVITATVAEKTIVVANAHTEDSSPVVILINDNGHFRGMRTGPIAAGKHVTLGSDDFEKWDDSTLMEICRQHWIDCGMTQEEATAIVKSWEPELLDSKGFLMISRIPRQIYDQIYPINITPAPEKLERTCMVFDTLSGQDNRKHWLPGQTKRSQEIMKELADADYKTRMRARANLIKDGEIMLPFVNEALANTDSGLDLESRMLLNQIQAVIKQSTVSVPEVKPAAGQLVPVPFDGGLVPVLPPGAEPIPVEGIELFIDG